MKQVWAVFGWIIVGALSAILGIGFFLYKANVDRAALAAENETARVRAEAALSSAKSLAEEANDKLAAASREIDGANARIKALEEEARLLVDAKRLSPSYASRRWSAFLDLPLGVGLRLPSAAREYENSARAFLAGPKFTATTSGPWVEIRPYAQSRETEWRERLQDSADAWYLVDDKLLVGEKGTLKNETGLAFVFRSQSAGTSTHLIWGRVGAGLSETAFLDVLGSLTFRQ